MKIRSPGPWVVPGAAAGGPGTFEPQCHLEIMIPRLLRN